MHPATIASVTHTGEGRAVGNLGNAYTALGQFDKAVEFHLRRLKIAEDQKDMVRDLFNMGCLDSRCMRSGPTFRR